MKRRTARRILALAAVIAIVALTSSAAFAGGKTDLSETTASEISPAEYINCRVFVRFESPVMSFITAGLWSGPDKEIAQPLVYGGFIPGWAEREGVSVDRQQRANYVSTPADYIDVYASTSSFAAREAEKSIFFKNFRLEMHCSRGDGAKFVEYHQSKEVK